MHKAFMLRVTCFLLLLSRRSHFTLLPNDLENYKSYNFRSKEKIKMSAVTKVRRSKYSNNSNYKLWSNGNKLIGY